MERIIVKDRQTLLDVAIQTSGSLEGLMELSIANGRSITDEFADGEELATMGVVDATVVKQYEISKIFPATEADEENRVVMPWGGVGFMGVEIDFVIL